MTTESHDDLRDYFLRPCSCGHGWLRHGPEMGGCIECRCIAVAPDESRASVLTAETMRAMRETHTPPRSVRIPDELWQAAKTKAAENGETVTDVIVRALERYVKRA